MSGSIDESVEMTGTEMDPATRTAVFDVLTDQERRAAVEYLAMATGAVPVDELVGFVEATSTAGRARLDSRQRTEIRFHHVHLPKLDDAGLLDYDPGEQVVTPTETVDVARRLIDRAADMRG